MWLFSMLVLYNSFKDGDSSLFLLVFEHTIWSHNILNPFKSVFSSYFDILFPLLTVLAQKTTIPFMCNVLSQSSVSCHLEILSFHVIVCIF